MVFRDALKYLEVTNMEKTKTGKISETEFQKTANKVSHYYNWKSDTVYCQASGGNYCTFKCDDK